MVDTCGDEISISDSIEYATSWLMIVGISSNEVKAIGLPTLVTADCPHGFGVLLWEGVWFFLDIPERRLPLLKCIQHRKLQKRKTQRQSVRH